MRARLVASLAALAPALPAAVVAAATFAVRAPLPRRTLVAVAHVIDLYAGLRRTD